MNRTLCINKKRTCYTLLRSLFGRHRSNGGYIGGQSLNKPRSLNGSKMRINVVGDSKYFVSKEIHALVAAMRTAWTTCWLPQHATSMPSGLIIGCSIEGHHRVDGIAKRLRVPQCVEKLVCGVSHGSWPNNQAQPPGLSPVAAAAIGSPSDGRCKINIEKCLTEIK